MNVQSYPSSVVDRLRTALADPSLPNGAQAHGMRLLERLEAPVRLVFLGWPNAERSALINRICDDEVLPKMAGGPSVELAFGTVKKAEATLTDGTSLIVPADSQVPWADAVFVSAEMPLPILRRISITNVVAEATEDEQLAAINWVLPRTDIALWCSEDFSTAERALWEKVPDALVDHAYLVLTGETAHPDRADALRSELSADFRDVFAIDQSAANTDPGCWETGGGAHLVSRIFRHIDSGQQADTDSALLFLKRYGETPDTGAASAAAASDVLTEQTDPESGAPWDFYRSGFDLLRDRGRNMLELVQSDDQDAVPELLSDCASTIDTLTEMLAAEVEASGPSFEDLSNAIYEAEGLIVLLQLENGSGPAADAVTLLLQLRREFEARLAA